MPTDQSAGRQSAGRQSAGRQSAGRQRQAKTLRLARKLHRVTGVLLFVFFAIIAVSGLLLGWKKNSGGALLPKTQRGTTADLRAWLPLDSLHTLACWALRDSVPGSPSLALSRIDVRQQKGVVKFVFEEHRTGVQLDGATGAVLQVRPRRSDLIEAIHDGSLLDDYAGTGGYFKLFYTSLTGAALLLFSATGFWLWYGPKRMRRAARSPERARERT